MNQTFKHYFLLVIVLLLLMVSSCSLDIIQGKQREGAEVVKKIEEFKSREHRLPKSLSEIGIAESEDGPIYYRQISETRYEVWYGTSLGESVTYDSDQKTWK
jgi:hypothetical protein